MSVRVQLDNPHGFYTNLDIITGKIILSLSSDEAVSAIVVKLEGESKTMLMRPRAGPGPLQNQNAQYYDRNSRGGIAMESHKILYKISQVFPSTAPNTSMSSGSSYTLRAGQHEYPFKFKIPFNNGCSSYLDPSMPMPLFPFGGQAQQLLYKHVKQTLPPSLSGFPGEAEIIYYVKVTVQRPSIWKENRRGAIGFRFMPMDAPRPPVSGRETFARRQHAFDAGLAGYARKSGLFSKAPKPLSRTPPSFQIDARLPEPAILTCHEPVPLRIIMRRKNQSPEQLFLVSLQIELIGYTLVEAQDVSRKEANTWVIMSSANLSIPIGSPDDEIDKETVLDSTLWNRIPLPNTVAPTFKTCNLGRIYELEVRVGVGYGTPNNIQPQKVHLPLRFPVQVFSGISPPTALVDRMASRPNGVPATPPRPAAPATPARPSAANTNTVPAPAPAPIVSDPLYPPQLGTLAAEDAPDAPPSYEDALADDLAPIDGPRRSYGGDFNTTGESDMGDEKAPRYTPRPGDSGAGGGSGR